MADDFKMPFGNPGPGNPSARSSPAFRPVPNSEPAGALTGAPPRTTHYSRPVVPASAVAASGGATQIVPGTPENRVAILLAPLNAWAIYIGGAGVTPGNGYQLPRGQPYEVPLPGLQELFAVTDAPIYLPLQVQISIVLMAEQQRPVGPA